MNDQEYIIKMSILTPGSVQIGDQSGEFTIRFVKIPVDYTNYIQWSENIIPLNQDNGFINVEVSLGEKIGDLCTEEEAANTKFTTLEGEGWQMRWSPLNKNFQVTPPENLDYTKDYAATFKTNGFVTHAQAGQTTLFAYPFFPNVKCNIATADLMKEYPVKIEYFKAEPEIFPLGGGTSTLSWKTRNASICFIEEKKVDNEGSMEVIITEPKEFMFTAKKNGMEARSKVAVGIEEPQITLIANPQDYNPITKQNVELSWKATSASIVSIPDLIEYTKKMEGKILITPTATRKYTAYAKNSFHDVPAISTQDVNVSVWKSIARVPLLRLNPADNNNMWFYNDRYYYIMNHKFYTCDSSFNNWNTIDWTGWVPEYYKYVSTILIKEKLFMFFNGDKNNINIFVYNISENKFEYYSSVFYENNFDPDCSFMGRVVVMYECAFYYIYLIENYIVIFSKNFDINWKLCLEYKLDINADQLDCISWNNKLYIAVRDSNTNCLTVYTLSDDEQSLQEEVVVKILEKKEYFRFILTTSDIYLLTSNNLISLTTLKRVSDTLPFFTDNGALLYSNGDTPIIMLECGDVYQANLHPPEEKD